MSAIAQMTLTAQTGAAAANANFIITPAFKDFMADVISSGEVYLTVNLNQLTPHQHQREVDEEHVHKLREGMSHSDERYIYPMLGCASYEWPKLLALKPYDLAPLDLFVKIYDGGHRLAAAKALGWESWPVKMCQEGRCHQI